LMRLLTVLMKQTRQAVQAIRQSIYLDVYGLDYLIKKEQRLAEHITSYTLQPNCRLMSSLENNDC